MLKNKAEFSNIIKQFTEDDKLDEIYKNDTGSFYPPKDRFKTKLLNYLGEAEYKPKVVIIESETNESHR